MNKTQLKNITDNINAMIAECTAGAEAINDKFTPILRDKHGTVVWRGSDAKLDAFDDAAAATEFAQRVKDGSKWSVSED
ncbi:MAG: hypothetical protein E6R03_01510 [Hyphomicrobiaceae bacterium]|nr:MAG: hypothetical protein E6R03_01510 [Hyphomicrobiaceae bacterium]